MENKITMRKVTDNELKSIELSILIEIDCFCKEHGLRYFLSSGSLLGAIRHKGFIPWDDDADVMMPRPDFDKFMNLYQSEKYILNYPGKPGYYQSIGKLAHTGTVLIQKLPLADEPIGVHVDILPLDGEPDDESEYKKHVYALKLLHRRTLHLRRLRFLPITFEYIKSCFQKWREFRKTMFMSMSCVYKRIDKKAHQYDYNSSNYVGYITMSRYGIKQRHRKQIFDDYILVQFEGYDFPAPVGYDEYLRNLFGDYMQLPPEDKRVSAHAWTAYWK